MPITEGNRIQLEKGYLEERKQFLNQVINASARYERLLANKDFEDMMNDLKKVAEIHERQIQGFLKEKLNCDNYFKEIRIDNVIKKHMIRKDQIQEAIGYPQRLIQEANDAREELSQIKEKEKQYNA